MLPGQQRIVDRLAAAGHGRCSVRDRCWTRAMTASPRSRVSNGWAPQINRYVIVQMDCDTTGDLGMVRSDSMSPETSSSKWSASHVGTWPPKTFELHPVDQRDGVRLRSGETRDSGCLSYLQQNASGREPGTTVGTDAVVVRSNCHLRAGHLSYDG